MQTNNINTKKHLLLTLRSQISRPHLGEGGITITWNGEDMNRPRLSLHPQFKIENKYAYGLQKQTVNRQ